MRKQFLVPRRDSLVRRIVSLQTFTLITSIFMSATALANPQSPTPSRRSAEPPLGFQLDSVLSESIRPAAAEVAFDLGVFYVPVEIPRDSVLRLRFNDLVDPASMPLDNDGYLIPDGPIGVLNGTATIPVRASIDGTDILLDARGRDAVGFPIAPAVRDASGSLRDRIATAKLTLITVGPRTLRSRSGSPLRARADRLGSPDAGGEAIGFLPMGPTPEFKMGASIPRIIRDFVYEAMFRPSVGDHASPLQMSITVPTPFNTTANSGLGEWAGAELVLRPGTGREERLVIRRNNPGHISANPMSILVLRDPISLLPTAGTPYRLERIEFFEPDPTSPIDPTNFDPLNPELANNQDLLHFVGARHPDGSEQDLTQPVHAETSLEVRFNTPMDPTSARPHESMRVTADPDPIDFGRNTLGRVEATDGGRTLVFRPEREVQHGPQAGTFESVGFGPAASALRFHLVSVPTEADLVTLLGAPGAQSFLNIGVRGLVSASGVPLATPTTFLSPQTPFANFSVPFSTSAAPSLVDHGAVVHRFMGRAETATGGVGSEFITGVTYNDVTPAMSGPDGNIYGNRVVEFNLLANGFLSGSPVTFLQKIHDDFNPPPTGQMFAFPFGASSPLGGPAVLGGARFQQVFRAVDASPDWQSYAGSELDLLQAAWSPIGGAVTNTTIPDITIHAGHSNVVPDTRQIGGIPQHPVTGLCDLNSSNAMGGHHQTIGNPNTAYVDGSYEATDLLSGESLRPEVIYGDETGTDSYAGKPYTIDNAFLFSPPGTGRTYHPLPNQEFDHRFAYDNGGFDNQVFSASSGHTSQPTWGGSLGDAIPHSLILEYRVRVADAANPPATQNGFTFAVGILSSALPRFRVFSLGTGCVSCCQSAAPGGAGSACKNSCAFLFNSIMTGLPGSGGSPLNPDLVTHAAGPAPAPPGMSCFCLPPPQNPGSCPAGLGSTQTGTTPTIDQVATGAVANPSGNNFGDNSRYFMVFNWLKDRSTIVTPFVRAASSSPVSNPTWLSPIVRADGGSFPAGTSVEVELRASTNGVGDPADSTPWVSAEDSAIPGSPLNDAVSRPFIQARMILHGDSTTMLVPAVEELVLPFRN